MEFKDWLFEVGSGKSHDFYFGSKKERRKRIADKFIKDMLLRTLQMFEWGGKDWETFSERIPQRDLELLTQINGVGGFIEHEGHFYFLRGNIGGTPNWNYMPMTYIVANPYLRISKEYNIYDTPTTKKDVVVMPNDGLYRGVMPILEFHAEVLSEIYLTKRLIMIKTRTPDILNAPTNEAKIALDNFIGDVMDGEFSSTFTKSFLSNIENIPATITTSHNVLTQILEMEQYQKAALFNDLGMQMNYNMKRETITSSEAQLGEGALLPLCDEMLYRRKVACDEIKKLWGLEITVEFSSAWRNLRKSIELAEQSEESKVVQTSVQSENNGKESDNKEYDEKGGEYNAKA